MSGHNTQPTDHRRKDAIIKVRDVHVKCFRIETCQWVNNDSKIQLNIFQTDYISLL